ncbi:hypothetical protein OG21DRAFT_145752 [Imleria badia]|nr:hypothetical protein OG21DRAFT_145752 [Imleria badia]
MGPLEMVGQGHRRCQKVYRGSAIRRQLYRKCSSRQRGPRVGFTTDNNFLLLIKAIILYECGKYSSAISCVYHLIKIVDDDSRYITVWAHMSLLLGGMLVREGHYERPTQLLGHVQDFAPFQMAPCVVLISIDFDKLDHAIQLRPRECIKPFEDYGDAIFWDKNPEDAMKQYSTALSLNPSSPAGLPVKRNKVRAMSGLWEEALKDADEAIEADPLSQRAYEIRHAALHALQRYGEAVAAFTRVLSLIKGASNQDIRHQCHFTTLRIVLHHDSDCAELGNKYISPSWSGTETIINLRCRWA